MTTYYRHGTVRVTSTAIEVDGAWYPLDELDDVWLERGPWRVDRAVAILLASALVVGAAVALVLAIAAVVLDPRRPSVGAVSGAFVWAYLLAGPFILAAVIVLAERAYDRGLRLRLLCAQVDGEAVTLYADTSARRFGQVHRAVVRALENGR